ncbi:MAG: DUF1963 domain-containing protein [Bacteroidales bacterium]|nr:DUF1963 domain-containing protein [Bacteroidales bacterium]
MSMPVKNKLGYLGLTICILCMIGAYLYFVYVLKTESKENTIIFIAFELLMLHGCHRAVWRIRHEFSPDSTEKLRLQEAKSFGDVAKIFFDPEEMRFRTSLSIFILVVLLVRNHHTAFGIVLAITLVLKVLVFASLVRLNKAFTKLKEVTGDENLKFDTETVNAISAKLPSFKRNSITIKFKEETGGESETGQTKFGGNPDVPDGFEWPKDSEGYPMSFILQINCSDIKKFDKENKLPKSGIFSFFYSWKNESMSYIDEDDDPSYNPKIAQVYYYDLPEGMLHRQAPPKKLAKEYRMTERYVSFSSQDCVPAWEDAIAMQIVDTDCSKIEYQSAMLESGTQGISDEDFNGSMLGYATPVEDDTLDEPQNEILLLQLFSSNLIEEDEGTEEECYDPIEFGVEGKVYFYISKKDLAERDFSRVRCQLSD